jgi:hypothetical protein
MTLAVGEEQAAGVLVSQRLALAGQHRERDDARRRSSEARDVDHRIVDALYRRVGGFGDWPLEDERAGVVRDAAHDVEPSGRARDGQRCSRLEEPAGTKDLEEGVRVCH